MFCSRGFEYGEAAKRSHPSSSRISLSVERRKERGKRAETAEMRPAAEKEKEKGEANLRRRQKGEDGRKEDL